MRDRLERYHYLLIVGCGPRAREMAALIEESRGMGLRLIGFVDPDFGDAPAENLGGYDGVSAWIAVRHSAEAGRSMKSFSP